MRPMDAKTFDEIASLDSDNVSTDNYWLSWDGDEAVLAKQKKGYVADLVMRIPRKDFISLVKWFTQNSQHGYIRNGNYINGMREEKKNEPSDRNRT